MHTYIRTYIVMAIILSVLNVHKFNMRMCTVYTMVLAHPSCVQCGAVQVRAPQQRAIESNLLHSCWQSVPTERLIIRQLYTDYSIQPTIGCYYIRTIATCEYNYACVSVCDVCASMQSGVCLGPATSPVVCIGQN